MSLKTRLLNVIAFCALFALFVGSTAIAADPTTSLRVGTSADYPPFSYMENGTYTGFDIELVQAIAKRLNYSVEIIDMPFKTLIAAIQLGTIDVIAAGLSETPERAKQVLFLPPHLEGSSLVILTKGKSITHGVSDLNGQEVIVNDGFTAAQYMQAFPEVHLQYLKSTSDALAALEANRAFAFVTSKNALRDFIKHHPKASEFQVFPIQETGEATSLATTKKQIKLYETMKRTLLEMKQDGSLDQLKKKWGLT